MFGNCRFYDAYLDKTYEISANETGIESIIVDRNQEAYDKDREKERRKRLALLESEKDNKHFA